MNTNLLAVIVIGAGHAGLSASYFLKQHRIQHVVLERGLIGESWASQRWDSFRMNTANKLNTLPGWETDETEPDSFGTAQNLVASMKQYVQNYGLPVLTNTTVISLRKAPGSELFEIQTVQNGSTKTYSCWQVIVASGAQSQKQPARLAGKIDAKIKQLHSSEYRTAADLPAGGVLVVGSAQSGCQIAEDLILAGRIVYLSTSRVPRCPRYYRGKDIMDWLILTGFFNVRSEDIADSAQLHVRTPLLKGNDNGRKTLSLQSLARSGVILLGKLQDVVNDFAYFSEDAGAHVSFADEFSAQVKGFIDNFIAEKHLPAPTAEPDPDDEPDNSLNLSGHPGSIQFRKEGISTIIWATGFRPAMAYIQLPVFDETGNPVHQQGKSLVKGLYFLGLPWLRNRKSSLLLGIKEDAQFITGCINTLVQKQTMVGNQPD
ncbi:flavin-containing monooxygenase [Adhaeribacter pallidiroseus]|uniref:Putative oxidoreductase CzcO-like n=1 Tax=Adhaeribacter pallidiroseus TaxID=2072847 RepID=A0A369QVP8_9BACT|nr:NAD(P)/FAD-dependent oxidoreductase [Adhaeribacter pallidiroseus]RDC66248.1 putative oxidoreductase CzcO-like [Adhaeribacter pallidiroseus]